MADEDNGSRRIEENQNDSFVSLPKTEEHNYDWGLNQMYEDYIENMVGDVYYQEVNPEIVGKLLKEKNATPVEVAQMTYLFISRGNNIDRIIRGTSDKGKEDIRKLVSKFGLKSIATSNNDLTLDKVALFFLPRFIGIPNIKNCMLGVLCLFLNEPKNLLAIPGMACIIPQDPKYDPLEAIILDFQEQIFKITAKSGERNDGPEKVKAMRKNTFFSEEKRIEILKDARILDADGNIMVV